MHHLFTSYTALVGALARGDVTYDQLLTGLFFFGCDRSVVEEGARQPVTRPSLPPLAPGESMNPMHIIRKSNGLLEHNARVAVGLAIDLASRPNDQRCAFRKVEGTTIRPWDQLWALLQRQRASAPAPEVWRELTRDADCCPSAIERVLDGYEITVHR